MTEIEAMFMNNSNVSSRSDFKRCAIFGIAIAIGLCGCNSKMSLKRSLSSPHGLAISSDGNDPASADPDSSGGGNSPTPSPPSTNGFNATSKILLRNPFTVSGNSSLRITDDLTPFLSNVDLDGISSPQELTDGYIRIGASTKYPELIVTPSADMSFDADDNRFYHTMAYYHAHSLTRALNAARLMPAAYSMITIDPQCVSGANSVNNAYLDPKSRKMCLGHSPQAGGLEIWAASDPDVIVHELGHGINHSLADAAFSSHIESGAIDEGLADVWAHLILGSPKIAPWYGLALLCSQLGSPGLQIAGGNPLRDLTGTRQYPTDLQGEAHSDSTVISQVLYRLHQIPPLNEQARMLKFTSRMLASVQSPMSFGSLAEIILEQATEAGIGAQARAILQDQGLYRKDMVSSLEFSSSDVKVVDNHDLDSLGFQARGNCNGQLDAGETSVLLLNLRNSGGTAMGSVAATLTTAAPANEIQIVPGGNMASYSRFLPNRNFLTSMISPSGGFLSGSSLTLHGLELIYSAFVVSASTTAHGSYPFSLRVETMNTEDGMPQIADIPFMMTVGSAATATSCSSGNGAQLWP